MNDREVYRGSTALILRSQRSAHRLQHAARASRHLLGDRQRGAAEVPAPQAAIRAVVAVPLLLRGRDRGSEARAVHAHRGARRPVRTPDARRSSSTRCRSRTSSRSSRARFVDESYSFYPYELILPCTSEELVAADESPTSRSPEGRLVAGFDVGRTRDRSELAVFEESEGRFICRLLRRFEGPVRRAGGRPAPAARASYPSRGSPSTRAASA